MGKHSAPRARRATYEPLTQKPIEPILQHGRRRRRRDAAPARRRADIALPGVSAPPLRRLKPAVVFGIGLCLTLLVVLAGASVWAFGL